MSKLQSVEQPPPDVCVLSRLGGVIFKIVMRSYLIELLSISFLLISLLNNHSFGQSSSLPLNDEIGQPFSQYFSPKDYAGLPDNWTIVQDKRGMMYFGNESDILEYDGSNWRRIKVPYSASVRSMALADDGTIYVCAYGSFGYLQPDSLGRLTYHSLRQALPEKYQATGQMWDVATSSEGVFFKTEKKIFKWSKGQMTVFDSVTAFRLYNINDRIYSRNQGVGLMVIDGDSLKVMPDGGFFSDIGVYDMLPFFSPALNKQGILITTNSDGLFFHDGKKFQAFKTNVDAYLIRNQVYNACLLSDGHIALATQRGGVVIIDAWGRLVRILNETNGLPTNVIYDVFMDKQGGLWLATSNGIVHCEPTSPFSIFKNSGVLKGLSSSVIRFKDTVYATNEFGVLYLAPGKPYFQLVEGSNKPAYELLDYEGTLLAGTNWGLVIIDQHKYQFYLFRRQTAELIASKVFPGRIYAGTREGLIVIQTDEQGHFNLKYKFEAEDEVYSIVEEKDGSLWLAGHFIGLYNVSGAMDELSAGQDANVTFTRFNKKADLPGSEWHIFNVQDKMYLSTDQGSFRFSAKDETFIPDSVLGLNLASAKNTVLLMEKGHNHHSWILARNDGVNQLGKAFLQQDGTYKWQPDLLFNRLDLKSARAIYPDIDPKTGREILWISTDEALVRYNPDILKPLNGSYSTLIRRVTIGNDSLLYGGTAPHLPKKTRKVVLPFSNNAIQFEFTAVSFDKPEGSQYQYLLEGNDEQWSDWTTENKKEYTNLSAGDFAFRIRSKNVYGKAGFEDVFYFTVLPPFYLTWWAYLLYGLFFLGGLFTTDRIMRKKIIKKERARAQRREEELMLKQAKELESIDNIVRLVNKEISLENLLKVLLEQGMRLFPQADNGLVLIFDHKTQNYKLAESIGHNIVDPQNMMAIPQQTVQKYAKHANEAEKGVYIIKHFDALQNQEPFNVQPVPKALIMMSATWDGKLEGLVVFSNLSRPEAFGKTDARKLRRFREHTNSAIVIARILKELQQTNEKIIQTRQQLITQEKLASLGQLTAGIAHEIKNPLNFVNNFAEISVDLMEELREELSTQKEVINDTQWQKISEIVKTLENNAQRINEHGKRADRIIKSMLQHSRGKPGERRETDLNAVLDENINLAYHGLRARDKSFRITIQKDFDPHLGSLKVVPQDISRVFLNILQNAFYAANKGTQGEPMLSVSTKKTADTVEIEIRDNGPGIPEDIRNKIFNPFFSNKPAGEGTGLGLSIAYDIVVKEHGGKIHVETREGEFTTFKISLPIEKTDRQIKEH